MTALMLALAGAVLVAASPIEDQTNEFFNNFYNPTSFYDENATLAFAGDPLKITGHYVGPEEIEDFYSRLAATIKFSTMVYEPKYMDGSTGRVKVVTKFKDGNFRGTFVDEDSKYFKGSETVDLIHHMLFDVKNGKLTEHDIHLDDPTLVAELGLSKAEKYLAKMIDTYYTKGLESVDELVDDDIEMDVKLSPKALLGGKRSCKGKEECKEFMELMKNLGDVVEQDDDDDDDDEKKEKSSGSKKSKKETKKRRKLLEKEDEDKHDDDADVKKDIHESAKYEQEVLFGDDEMVETVTHVEEITLKNGKVVRDFDLYRTFYFDEDGLLTKMEAEFGRLLKPWEVFAKPEQKEDEGEEKKEKSAEEKDEKNEDEDEDEDEDEKEMKGEKKKDEDEDEDEKESKGEKKGEKKEDEDEDGDEDEDEKELKGGKKEEEDEDGDEDEDEKELKAGKKEDKDEDEDEDVTKKKEEEEDEPIKLEKKRRRLLQFIRGSRTTVSRGPLGGVSATRTTGTRTGGRRVWG